MSKFFAFGLSWVALTACGRSSLDAGDTQLASATGGVTFVSAGRTSIMSGGRALTGGTRATGGFTSQGIGGTRITTGGHATGGTSPTGGRTPTGGNSQTGGRAPTGGSSPTGGVPFTPTGGKTATGGTTFAASTAGRTATGGTTVIYDTGAQCTYGSCGPCGECAVISQKCQPLKKGTAGGKADACFTSFSCDGAGACQGDVPAPPSTPVPMRPISGTRTGSPFSTAALSRRRPTFVWSDGASPACTGMTYDLQVDDSCTDVTSCTFPSPEIDAKGLTRGTFSPMEDLPVNLSPPVGRRYVWRVRGCRNGTCSTWSATRYVDVGRAQHDYNGDGYSDLAIGAVSGEAVVVWGSASGLYSDSTLVATDRKVHHGTTGDINGDGFSDLIVFSYDAALTPGNNLAMYLGSATGLSPTFSWTSWATVRWSVNDHPIFGAADFDGDGYMDLVANDGSMDATLDYFGGSPNPFDTEKSRSIGPGFLYNIQRFGSGDFNGDALSDLVTNDVYSNSASIYLSSSGSLNYVSSTISGIAKAGTNPCIATVDQDADGRDDLMLGMGGFLYFFRGSTTGIPQTPDLTTPNAAVSSQYGKDCTSGELLGHPGVADLAVSDPGSMVQGSVYVYEGGTHLFQWLGPVLRNTSAVTDTGFGTHLQVPGDLNGDGFEDLVVCDQHPSGGRALVFSGPTATSSKGTVVQPLAGVTSFCSDLY